MSSPLVAGGGDSVAGVILLSFPQAGTGCRFEALVSVFQQAGSKKDVGSWCYLHYWMAFMAWREARARVSGLLNSCWPHEKSRAWGFSASLCSGALPAEADKYLVIWRLHLLVRLQTMQTCPEWSRHKLQVHLSRVTSQRKSVLTATFICPPSCPIPYSDQSCWIHSWPLWINYGEITEFKTIRWCRSVWTRAQTGSSAQHRVCERSELLEQKLIYVILSKLQME